MANKPISVTIKGDYTDRDVKRAIRDLESLQTQAPKTTRAMGGLSKAMVGLAAGFSAGAVLRGLQSTITAASDLAESQSKVRVVFGQSAREIQDWSKTSSTSMLMTQQAALESAGTFGNLFQSFGIGQGKATEMSKSLVELAADLASFNNTSTEDAILALRSGLSGETEPLKRFGVALTDARLRQEALNMGIYDGKGILDITQKSQAAYALILKDTALAQGDVERTADGYANTLRAVESAVGNAQAAIGEELLMGIQEVTKSLGGAKGLVSLIDELGASMVDVIRPARDFFSVFAEGNRDLENATGLSLDFANSIRNGIGFVLGPTSSLLYRYSDAAQEADEKSLSMGATLGYARDNFSKLAIAAGIVDENMELVTDGTEAGTEALKKQKSAVDKLRDSLDKLNGKNRSVMENRIALRGLRRDGPGQSGERKVKGKDGKVTTERFSTRDDRLSFGLDYAAQVEELAQALADRPGGADDARRVLSRGRKFLTGQFGKGFANDTLSTPAWLDRGDAGQRAGGQRYEQGSKTENNYYFGDLMVRDMADAAEQARRAARLKALAGRQTASSGAAYGGYSG